MAFKTVDLNRFMDDARMNLPGALDGSIHHEFFNVLTDFCNRTNLWIEDITFPVTAANVRDTTVDITPSSGRINRLMYVWDADKSQRKMGMPEPGVLLFVEAAPAAGTWTARVALAPKDPVPTQGVLEGFPDGPDWLMARYRLGLLSGVLGQMMVQVGKPYTNARMAQYHLKKYLATISEGKTEARHQNLFAGQTWRFPPGFAGTR